MNLKNKLGNYGFWTSLIAGVVLLLQAAGLKINYPVVNEIITAVMGVLVALGIISNPGDNKWYFDKTNKD